MGIIIVPVSKGDCEHDIWEYTYSVAEHVVSTNVLAKIGLGLTKRKFSIEWGNSSAIVNKSSESSWVILTKKRH